MDWSQLKDGDLIFVHEESEMAEAIKQSTGNYSHVAIFLEGLVYHASPQKGVCRESLKDFVDPLASYDIFAYPAIKVKDVQTRAQSLLGQPYNASFYPEADGYYCSEFLAEILPIFPTVPMQFGHKEQVVADFWSQYFQVLGTAVPLGLPGTNPSGLSRHPHLIKRGRIYDQNHQS